MEKQYMLDYITLKDSWRLFHIMAEFVEGFELAAFGGDGGINRGAAGIQIRRDALLLRQRRKRHLNLAEIALAQALPRSSGETGEDLVLSPRSGQAVGQELVIELRCWADDTHMLVDVPLAKAVWHKRATTDGCSRDVQQHIARAQFRAGHLLMSVLGDVGHVVESQAVEMHVLASQQWDAGVEI